jgi:hypothetical protein
MASRGRLRLGRTAAALSPAGTRRLPLRGAQPARLRAIECASPPRWTTDRTKHLVQDVRRSLAAIESADGPLDCAGGARLGRRRRPGASPTSLPELTRRLAILNSPHPGTFLRELQSNPRAAAGQCVHELPDPSRCAESTAGADDYRRHLELLHAHGRGQLTDAVKQQYTGRVGWSRTGGPPGMQGCAAAAIYYARLTPLKPAMPGQDRAAAMRSPCRVRTPDDGGADAGAVGHWTTAALLPSPGRRAGRIHPAPDAGERCRAPATGSCTSGLQLRRRPSSRPSQRAQPETFVRHRGTGFQYGTAKRHAVRAPGGPRAAS